jgi:hypothetical protein
MAGTVIARTMTSSASHGEMNPNKIDPMMTPVIPNFACGVI